jgi:GAF domain-containing protein
MPSAFGYDLRMPTNPATDYDNLCTVLDALLQGEHDRVASLATAAALVYDSLDNVNWAGFYLLRDSELVVGPYQGQPACIRIAMGRGVCGTAAEQRTTQLVPDVHDFDGHIACDARSRSELVVPVITDAGELIGVFDIDSPSVDRFSEQDARGIERIVERLLPHL